MAGVDPMAGVPQGFENVQNITERDRVYARRSVAESLGVKEPFKEDKSEKAIEEFEKSWKGQNKAHWSDPLNLHGSKTKVEGMKDLSAPEQYANAKQKTLERAIQQIKREYNK